jgi:hypothetical protein
VAEPLEYPKQAGLVYITVAETVAGAVMVKVFVTVHRFASVIVTK